MQYTAIIALFVLASCNDRTKPAGELVGKKADTLLVDPIMIPPGSIVSKPAADTLSITALPVSGNMGQTTFSKNDSTLFYFSETSFKGKIRLNGREHVINKVVFGQDDNSFKLYGKDLVIETGPCVIKEHNGEDCGYGSFREVVINLGPAMLKLNNIDVQFCGTD
jgi:hypothetical protein